MSSLADVRKQFRDELAQVVTRKLTTKKKASVKCPCCGDEFTPYSRHLNTGQAKNFISIVRAWLANGRTWVDIESISEVRGGDYAKLAWETEWALIEQRPTTDDVTKSAKRSGVWRPTERGLRFFRNELRVPMRVIEIRSVPQLWSKHLISLEEALGQPFDYRDLWK
jgi:hypothetical protein